MKGQPFFARYAWWILIGFALATPLIVYAAFRTVRSNTNKVEDWLPASFAETHDLAWFRRFFVADQFLLISWEGCRLGGNPAGPDAVADDPRIERLAQMLVPSEEGDPVARASADDSLSRYFRSVTTGRRVLTQLTSPPSNVPYDVAVERLKGSLLGPDGRQTCLIMTLTDEGLADLRHAIGRGSSGALQADHDPGALFQACAACGIPADTAHVGGPPVDNVSIDEEGERTLVRLAVLSGVLGLVLAWFSLRSVTLTLIVFAVGILSAASGLGAVWLSGETSDAVLMSMPALVYVLAVSGAIHIINYYHDAVQEGGLAGAPERALRHGWRPAVLCAVTTSLGLLSLYASDLEPIRKFGVYSATGVFAMLGVLLLFLPAALQVWPIPAHRRLARNGQLGHPGAAESVPDSWADRFWFRFGSLVIRRHATVAIGSVLLVFAVGWGITRTRTSIDLLKLFDGQARILVDYRWLEEHLGRLIPMEVVLRFPPEMQRPETPSADEATADEATEGEAAVATAGDGVGRLSFLDRMEIVSIVQQSVERRLGPDGRDLVGRTMSAVTFAPELPSTSGSMLNYVRRSVTSQRLADSRTAFESTGYFRVDPADGAELWRISLRVAAFEDIDFGEFVNDLRQAVEPVLAAHRYRGDVLRKVAAERDDQRVAGATVLLWQHPEQAPKPIADERGSAIAAEVNGAAIPSVDIVFSASLNAFLRRDRLRVSHSRQDAATLSQAELERMRQFDVVVLTGDFHADELAKIRGAVRSFVVAAPMPAEPPAPAAGPSQPEWQLAATYTGVVPIVYKTQRVLLTSLVESAFWSFITITPLLMFVCRGVMAGAVAMLPNVLPVLAVFGGMGWLGLPIDIGSMMAASIALGVAVDDTIHYLTWFRDDLDVSRHRRRAILYAYRRCATPTLQAALVNGLGLSVFAFSTFMPTRQFGFLMLTILIAGVVAELVMLPALLAGPLGIAFRPKAETGGVAGNLWRRLTRRG